jgi:hypothetical protein
MTGDVPLMSHQFPRYTDKASNNSHVLRNPKVRHRVHKSYCFPFSGATKTQSQPYPHTLYTYQINFHFTLPQYQDVPGSMTTTLHAKFQFSLLPCAPHAPPVSQSYLAGANITNVIHCVILSTLLSFPLPPNILTSVFSDTLLSSAFALTSQV